MLLGGNELHAPSLYYSSFLIQRFMTSTAENMAIRKGPFKKQVPDHFLPSNAFSMMVYFILYMSILNDWNAVIL